MRMIDTCGTVKSYARKNNELKPRRCNEDFVVKIKGQCITAEEKEMLEENPGWRKKIASTIHAIISSQLSLLGIGGKDIQRFDRGPPTRAIDMCDVEPPVTPIPPKKMYLLVNVPDQ